MGCIIALDVGTRTIGIARAQRTHGIPTPHCTLSRQGVKKDTAKLVHIIQELRVETVVVGLPYELDDTEGRSARLARQIGESVKEATGIDVHYQDERYSTVVAEERLIEGGYNAQQRKGIIDQAAAAVILSDWLETRR